MHREHVIFERFPLKGEVTLSTGTIPTPYHIYDGYGFLIAGTADPERVAHMIKNEAVIPAQTANRRVVVAMFLLDFTDASLAPHSEFQCSVFLQTASTPLLEDHDFAPFQYIFTTPDAAQLCANIWNNTTECVAYNSEHLGLGAQLCNSRFTHRQNEVTFTFASTDGAPLIEGQIQLPIRTSLRDTWDMLRLAGLRNFIQAIRADAVTMDVVNRKGLVIPEHKRATAYSAPEQVIVARFNPNTDRLSFGDIPFGNIDFQPTVYQYYDGFKFVYLDPDKPL